MAYLLDSDWIIDSLFNVPEAVRLLEELTAEGVAISIITYIEAYEGVLASANPKEAEGRFTEFLQGVPVLPLSPSVARRCAEVRHVLRKQGKRVQRRALDLIIAATALEHDLTLVTRNRQDYDDIPALKLHTAT